MIAAAIEAEYFFMSAVDTRHVGDLCRGKGRQERADIPLDKWKESRRGL